MLSGSVTGSASPGARPALIPTIETKSFEYRSAGHTVLRSDTQDLAGELTASGQLMCLGAANAEGPPCRVEIDTDGQRPQLLQAHPTIHAVDLPPTLVCC